ncbi:unnamed protein product [Victoria cruziana]
MECNKDEAIRAKEIAEKKFKGKDLEGAKKFALKASQLYPTLEGIVQMVATFDVYVAAEKKINGEIDWYEILCVSAVADDETVKKQYRKLALMLHPDKNKSIGAEGAFKLVSEAWSVLSDKFRRSAYDHKRNLKSCQPKASQPSRAPAPPRANSAPPRTNAGATVHTANGYYNFASSNVGSNARTQKPAPRPPVAPPVPRQPKPSTFWTSCNRCRMQYEYLRVYVNHNLLCPNCHEPFLAIETGTVPCASGTFPWTVPQQHGHPNQNAHGKNAHVSHKTNLQWGAYSRTAGVPSANVTTSAAGGNAFHQTYDKIRREETSRNDSDLKRTSSGPYAGNSKAFSGGTESFVDRPVKKRRSGDGEGLRNGYENMDMDNGNVSGYKHSDNRDAYEAEKLNGVSKGVTVDAMKGSRFPCKQNGSSLRDLMMQDVRTVLMAKARSEIQKKLEDWKSEAAEKAKEKGKGLQNGNANVQDQHKPNESMKKGKKEKPSNKQHVAADGSDEEADGLSAIHVIDADFHDFDEDRCEKAFAANQIWAAYDDDDGMPRFYALIQKVISVEPFKMRISWLNSKNNSDLGPIKWVSCGFTKTSGEFRVGRYELNNNVYVFSHKVRWEKGLRGVIRILPGKGEVWAIYRNWSENWNESTADEVIHKYDMVEVVDDFVEDRGVSVAPLLKVPSFKTVFRRTAGSQGVLRIPKEEFFRFSHQVPSYLLTGEEAKNAPKGFLELDPAATPQELLEPTGDAKNEKIEERTEG